MLRVAIIGCGKIADQHVAAIQRIKDCKIDALCDQELMMARQLGERFGISQCFDDVKEMLQRSQPDVVHITTPPHSHYGLGKLCLESGCHVYLEKPFTIHATEARELIRLAEHSKLKLTVGHNLQFTAEMVEMRRQVSQGFLGGKPVHLESFFPYNLKDMAYVGPILGNQQHWVRRLPGKLFHNIISHGIARLVEFLDDDIEDIVTIAHQSPELEKLGGGELLDELRVILRDGLGTTAFFCFSTEIRPPVNQMRIFGPKRSLAVDHGSGSLIRNQSHTDKSYLAYFLPPLRMAREHSRCGWKNILSFLRQRLHQDAGMKELIERFYESVRTEVAPPIPYREIMLTARIMDEIFLQIDHQERQGLGDQSRLVYA